MNESGSEASYFIPEPRNFSEVAILLEDIKKPWIKATQKGIKNSINDQNFLVQEPDTVKSMTPCMDVYSEKINLMEVLTS